jgi:hypothetical protein
MIDRQPAANDNEGKAASDTGHRSVRLAPYVDCLTPLLEREEAEESKDGAAYSDCSP